MKTTSIYIVLSLACVNAMHAQEISISPITVTAEPIIEDNTIDSYSSFSTTVTENQLHDQNAIDLASTLRHTPGVEISRYNPVGSFGGDQGGAVYIRGMGTSRPGSEIKTYIDGVPFYMGVWNHPLLDLLPINGMKSITINKSPQPHLNGNNFASINLETKHADQEGGHGDIKISAGSFGTVTEQVNLSVKKEAMDMTLAQGYAKSDGHRTNSDGQLNNIMGRVSIKLTDNISAGVSVIAVDNKAKDPYDNRQTIPAIPPQYNSEATMLSAFINHQNGTSYGEFRAYSNTGKGNLYNDGRPNIGWGTFLTNFDMNGFILKEHLSPWKNAVIDTGIDLDNVSGEVNGKHTAGWIEMPRYSLTSPHIALSEAFELNSQWTLIPSIGLRAYRHSQYESKTAPHAGLSLVSESITLFANASRGINYPGLDAAAIQAAMPAGLFTGTTWQQLAPEELNHYEAGIKLNPNNSTEIDLILFSDEVKNRYVYDINFVNFGNNTFYNLGNYRTNGAELSVKEKINTDLAVFAGLTLLNPNRDNLPYNPKQAITAGINGKASQINFAIDAQYQSEVYALSQSRDTLTTNTEKVNAYTVVNARLSYPMAGLGKKGEVFISGENLFDTNYAYRPGYPMPGINGQIGLSASF